MPELRAEIKDISLNDYDSWDALEAAARPDPWDFFSWFTLSIGPDDEPGSEYFEVLVATPAAVTRAQGNSSRFKGVVVDIFEPEVIQETLQEHVSRLRGTHWHELVAQLQQSMSWEYER